MMTIVNIVAAFWIVQILFVVLFVAPPCFEPLWRQVTGRQS